MACYPSLKCQDRTDEQNKLYKNRYLEAHLVNKKNFAEPYYGLMLNKLSEIQIVLDWAVFNQIHDYAYISLVYYALLFLLHTFL